MRWIIMVPLMLLLSACCNVYESNMVTYHTVEVAPPPPTFVVDHNAPVDVTTTDVDYY